jgi:hypothetical protein
MGTGSLSVKVYGGTRGRVEVVNSLGRAVVNAEAKRAKTEVTGKKKNQVSFIGTNTRIIPPKAKDSSGTKEQDPEELKERSETKLTKFLIRVKDEAGARKLAETIDALA